MNPTATAFAEARRRSHGLAQWPGALPETLEQAYRLQAETQAAWGLAAGGVKVGRVLGPWAERLGVDRFTGPVDAAAIQASRGDESLPFPVIAGGTALLECEILAVLGRDAPSNPDLSPEAARALVQALHIGIEIAGCPLAGINALGPLASIACFGNNNGAILGPALPPQHIMDPGAVACIARIDGRIVGEGDTSRLPGGVWAAVAFACAQTARLGAPLRAGSIICTGALTGMHPIEPGQQAEADFGPLGTLRCRALAQGAAHLQK